MNRPSLSDGMKVTDIEVAIRYARDEINSKNMFAPTAQNLVDLLGESAETALGQIRLSYGHSLIGFFNCNPSAEQLINILDQTLQDLTFLRRKA